MSRGESITLEDIPHEPMMIEPSGIFNNPKRYGLLNPDELS